MNLGELSEGHTPTGEPAVKRQRMSRLDIDDGATYCLSISDVTHGPRCAAKGPVARLASAVALS